MFSKQTIPQFVLKYLGKTGEAGDLPPKLKTWISNERSIKKTN